MIDTHIHVANTLLPGSPAKAAPDGTPLDGPLAARAEAIRREMDAGGVEHALCMPQRSAAADDPLGVAETLRVANLVPGRLHAIGIADPTKIDPEHLARTEAALAQGSVVAFKAYLGYLHHGPDSPGYVPYYRLAAKYKIPVIFHTGDNYSHLAKLKYAHPLLVDEVAVDYPDVNFVLAHFGYPWLIDAAEVLYKNNKAGVKENVWADLSGIVVGSAADFARYRDRGDLKVVADQVRIAFSYSERPDRFLFGTDWPLAPMADYAGFIRDVIPADYHRLIFHDNARALFRLEGRMDNPGR